MAIGITIRSIDQ